MTNIAFKEIPVEGTRLYEKIHALKRLLEIAHRDSGQCRHVARFLLSLYNGERFPFDLTDFRCLDVSIFQDCLAVLVLDFRPPQEVQEYFVNGGRIWEGLAKFHGIRSHNEDWRWVKRK